MDESQLEIEQRYNDILRERSEITTAGNISSSEQSDLSERTNSLIRERTKRNKRSSKSQKDLAGQLEKSASAQDGMNKSMKEGTQQAGIYQKVMASLTYAYEGIYKPLKSFYDLITMKGVYDFLISTGAEYSSQMKEMYMATQNLKDSIGDLSGSGGRRYNTFIKNLSASTSALTQSGKSLSSIFGLGVADVMKGVTEEIKKMGVQFDVTMDAINGSEGEFMLLNKGLGISSEALGTMARGSKDAKADFTELAVSIASGAAKFGINMKSAGKNVDSALKDVKNFGYMSRKELGETALYATRLGLEMSDLTSFGAKFDTFEGAAEAVGKLSSAFGIQLDTMEMVMEDNPAKKLDMVREALEAQGKTMDEVLGDRKSAQYLSDTIGIPIDKLKELQNIGTDEFGFDSIADDMQGPEMTELEAMQSMADQMKSLSDHFKDVSGVKSFFGAFQKGFSTGFKRSPAFRKMFGDINDSLRKFMVMGEKVAMLVSDLFYKPKKIDGVVKNVAVFADIFEGFLEYFKQMGQMADKYMGANGPISKVFKILKDFASGKVTSGKGQPNIFELLLGPFLGSEKSGQGLMNEKIRNGFIKVAVTLGNILADAFRYIGSNATKWIEELFAPKVIKSAVTGGTGAEKLKETGVVLMDAFGAMLGGLGKLASGLVVYFIGGTYGEHTVSWDDSVIGSLWNAVKERAGSAIKGAPGMASKAGGFLLNMINKLFGFEGIDAAMSLQNSGFKDKMTLMKLKLKETIYTTIADLMKDLKQVGRDGLATYPDIASTSPIDGITKWFDLSFHIYEQLSKLNASGFTMAATRASQEAEQFGAQMKIDADHVTDQLAAVYRDARLKTEATESLSDIIGDQYEMNLGPGKAFIEVNQENYDMIVADIKAKGQSIEELRNEYAGSYSDNTPVGSGVLLELPTIEPELSSNSKLMKDAFDEGAGYEENFAEGISAGNNVAAAGSILVGDLGNSMINAADMHSPSRKAAELGYYWTEGFVEGVFGGPDSDGLSLRFAEEMGYFAEDVANYDFSNEAYATGANFTEGFIAGIFGEDSSTSSDVSGLHARFADQMEIVRNKIDESYKSLAGLAVTTVETKLGQFGQILRGEKPMAVIVSNDKVDIKLALNVTMDTKDIAYAMGTAEGGTYFTINTKREDSDDFFKAIEESAAENASMDVNE